MERLWPPGIPVDRIVGVLQEIWRFLVDEAVGVFVDTVWVGHGWVILSAFWMGLPLLYTHEAESIDACAYGAYVHINAEEAYF
ncbi:hypothetical protein [Alicyclobacillus tolerans]|uniref:hypothetical protein n=1 Tax=Alicyclobacillus tolerans TaxID=90970 RepID=UPI001F619142|nr:hypothetical protein [Alicyclobacillus montanus]